jgi:EAL and modified HD-GYP domain-containing signal transduction protein
MLDEGTDFSELAATIQADVSVSYRLLQLINSAAFGYKDIDSIERAVVLLGWEKLKNWVYLVVLTDIQPKGKSSELPYLSTIRAKFLESAAQAHKVTDPKPQSLFLLGLFSLLDAMLDQPMSEVLEQLPLDAAISEALSGEDNELAPWLELARCFETGDWARLDRLVDSLGLDATATAGAYFEAIGWTKHFFQYD